MDTKTFTPQKTHSAGRLMLLALLLWLPLLAVAQAPDIVWQNALGGSSLDLAYAITPSGDGGFVVAGYTFSNNGDVSGNQGNEDLWVVKLDGSGNIVWQKSLGGSSFERATAVTPSDDGGFVVAGTTSSNDGDVSGNHGKNDFWVVKLDASGNLVWQKTLGGSNDDFANAITPSGDGGFVVAGYTNSNDGDVSGNHGNTDFWVVKLDGQGNLLWQKAVGGSTTDNAAAITPSGDGGFVVAGITDIDGGASGNSAVDARVVKLDASGNLVWQKTLIGSGFDVAAGITSSGDGGFVVAGSTSSNDGDASASTDVDGAGHHGGGDLWVVKLGATTPPPTNTGIRYVNASRPDDSGDGLSWATAHKSLQTALSAAVSGDKIWVASGTYKPTTQTGDRDASFVMKENVAIYGGFTSGQANLTDRNTDPATNSTVLSGDINNDNALSGNSYSVLFVQNAKVTASSILDGFKITGGNANATSGNTFDHSQGGGMLLGIGSPTVSNCLFQDNYSFNSGGGVWNGGSPKFSQCTFIDNSAGGGGAAVFTARGSTPSTEFSNCKFMNNTANGSGGALFCAAPTRITDCTFTGNSSSIGQGGAVASRDPDIQILRCTFSGNSAPISGGGAIYHETEDFEAEATKSLSVTDCSFLNNTAFSGGVIHNFGGSPSFINCSFIGNSAGGRGGVLSENGGKTKMINCSFQGNSAAVSGGAVYITQNAAVTVTNSVFWNNGGANTIGTGGAANPGTVTLAYSLIDQQDVPAGTGNKVTSTNPFVSMTSNVLRDGSPAIDMGLNSANTTTTDLAGNPRVFNNTIDMGAYEAQTTVTPPAESPTVANLSASPNPICAGQPVTFTASVGNTSGTYDYTLTNNNGTTKTGQASGSSFSQSVTASGSGSQTFTLTVTNSDGSGSDTEDLTVNAAPAAPMLSASPGNITTNQPITVTAIGCAGTANWTSGGGMGVVSGNTITFSQPGGYTLSATCTQNGCTGPASGTLSLTINPANATPPTVANLTASPSPVCAGQSVTFTATVGNTSGNYDYTLTNNNGTSKSGTVSGGSFSQSVTAAGSGSQTFTLTVTNSDGSGSGNTSLTVNALPAATLTNDGPLTTAKTTVTLTAGGGSSYSFGAGASQQGGGNTATVSAPGQYTVTVTGSGGCTAQASTTVGQDGTPPPPPPAGNCLSLGDRCSGNQFEIKSYNFVQAAAGARTLALVYETSESSVAVRLTINGTLYTFTLPRTPANRSYVSVNLPGTYNFNAGDNAVTLASGGGYFCLRQLCAGQDPTAPTEPVKPVTPPPAPGTFAITGVSDPSCVSEGGNRRRITFTPTYANADGSAITFSIDNEKNPTTAPGPYAVSLYLDKPLVTLRARQGGTNSTFEYFWQGACQGGTTPPPVVTPPPAPGTFAITGVSDPSCVSEGGNRRRVTFTPTYANADGSAIFFSIDNEKNPTTAPGPYAVSLYLDKPSVTLRARQGGANSTFEYFWQGACETLIDSRRARVPAGETVIETTPLTAYPNPATGSFEARFYVQPGQRANLSVSDMLGRRIWAKDLIGEGGHEEKVRLPEASGGMYILRLQRAAAASGGASAEFQRVIVVE